MPKDPQLQSKLAKNPDSRILRTQIQHSPKIYCLGEGCENAIFLNSVCYTPDEVGGVIAGGRAGPRGGGGRLQLLGGAEAAPLPRQGAAQEESGENINRVPLVEPIISYYMVIFPKLPSAAHYDL